MELVNITALLRTAHRVLLRFRLLVTLAIEWATVLKTFMERHIETAPFRARFSKIWLLKTEKESDERTERDTHTYVQSSFIKNLKNFFIQVYIP